VQTAEGALTETHSILQRMRDLAVQSGNDANDTDSRAAINSEATALKSELDRIAGKTTYNNIKLLDGTFTGKQFQVGYAANDTITVGIQGGATAASNLFTDSTVSTAGTFTFEQAADSTGSTTVAAISVTTESIGVTTSTQQTVDALNADEAFATAFSASVDSATGQLKVTAKSGNQSAVTVDLTGGGSAVGVTAGAGTAGTDTGGGFNSTDLGLSALSLATQAGATTALSTLDTAIKTVSTSRANLGALQNRFEHTINNLNVAIENLSASESRIRDTDMAQEMMSFTRAQILSQAGTAMLAQANQAPQGVLSLLR
jgi:flagellin